MLILGLQLMLTSDSHNHHMMTIVGILSTADSVEF